jgi:4'-phosphopantetheinyl transferase
MPIVSWSDLADGLRRPPKLDPGQIHLWHASVSVPPAISSVLIRDLSDDERARAARFRFQRDRDSYVVSRALLRQLLAAYTGDPPAWIRFGYGAQGKPAIASAGSPSLSFNVAHSGDAVLLGFAADREIGVDVERMQNGMDFAGLAQSSFSLTERDAVLALAPEKRASLFYEYWTCKEACIKADGRGLSIPLGQFSIVESVQGPQWREVAVANPGVFEAALCIRILGTMKGYAAAIAAPGTGWDVVRMDLLDANALQE